MEFDAKSLQERLSIESGGGFFTIYHVNVQDTTTRRRRDEDSHRILTTRREALSLYREIVRITALFDWPNEQGIPWRDILRESARKEFEEARYESDPEVINRLLVVGRDAVHQVAEKFMQKHKDFTNFGSGESPNGTSLK